VQRLAPAETGAGRDAVAEDGAQQHRAISERLTEGRRLRSFNSMMR
jgi:hypothetical protein